MGPAKVVVKNPNAPAIALATARVISGRSNFINGFQTGGSETDGSQTKKVYKHTGQACRIGQTLGSLELTVSEDRRTLQGKQRKSAIARELACKQQNLSAKSSPSVNRLPVGQGKKSLGD